MSSFKHKKGGALVVQNRTDYLNKAKRHLNSTDVDGNPVYEKLSNAPIQDFNKRIQDVIDSGRSNEVIGKNLSEILFVEDPKVGNLYFLPKIHKKKSPPPGRPICNNRGTMTENSSKWTDLELQPLVKELPSYIKDNTDFVKKLEEINKSIALSENALLVTWDIKSPYTSIPYKECLYAVVYYLESSNTSSKKTKIILDFTELILTSNIFRFGSDYFLQKSGIAMANVTAPFLANLFMGLLEQNLLSKCAKYH